MTSATLARVEAHVFRVPVEEPVRTSFGTMTERAAVTCCGLRRIIARG